VSLRAGRLLSGPGELCATTLLPADDFVNPADFDYRLKAGAAAIGHGVDPGRAVASSSSHGRIRSQDGKRPRGNSGTPDVGALNTGASVEF